MGPVYSIPMNLQIIHDDNLLVSSGNFQSEDYTDDQGVSRRGTTAALWMHVNDGSFPVLRGIRVHVGQEIKYARYLIQVVEISATDQRTPFVNIAINTLENPGGEWPTTLRVRDKQDAYAIPANTQLIYYDDNLLAGTADFWPESYMNEQGTIKLKREDAAGLWLAVRDGSLPNQHMRVEAGREISFGKYSIKVVEVCELYTMLARGVDILRDRKDFMPFIRVAISDTGKQ